jgi:hypothetical protein
MSNGRLGGRGLPTAPRRKQTLVTVRFGSEFTLVTGTVVVTLARATAGGGQFLERM